MTATRVHALPRQRHPITLPEGFRAHWGLTGDYASDLAPQAPTRPELHHAPPGEDAHPVVVVGTCHACDTHGPVALLPVWEAPGVRGLDDAVCLPCAATRLTTRSAH